MGKQQQPPGSRHGVSKSAHGSSYTIALRKLGDARVCARRQLLSATRDLALSREREAVLVELVLHQEQILVLLAEHRALLQRPDAHALLDSDAACLRGALQSRLSISPNQAAASYTAGLLRRATPQQVAAVMAMTADDWTHELVVLFPRLVVLLELMNRCEHMAEADDAGGSGSGSSSPQQQPGSAVPGSTGPSAGAAGADTPAAGAQANGRMRCWPVMADMLGLQGELGASPSADAQQLERMVDATVTKVLLAYMHNHCPMLEAAMRSYAPGMAGISVVPHGHWERVTDRLQLSEAQALHLSLAWGEYVRMTQQASAEGSSLLRRSEAATHSMLAAAAARRARVARAWMLWTASCATTCPSATCTCRRP